MNARAMGSPPGALAHLIRHMALGGGCLGLIVAAAVGAVALWGSPDAGAPRAVVALQTGSGEAPRVGLLEAAIDPMMIAQEDAGFFEDPLASEDPFEEQDVAAPPEAAEGRMEITMIGNGAPSKWRASPLPRAPLPGLHENGPKGSLPIIAADGRTVSTAYARPFSGPGDKPKIALVIGGLGINARLTQAAIDELPSEITLSFVPYASDLQTWIDKARANGHEVMIEAPMEPFDAAHGDTGPQTLTAGASARENLERLETILSSAVGYFGVTNYQGARFAASKEASGPVVQALKARGLVFVGSALGPRTAMALEAGRAGLPFTSADRIIDARREADAIDEQLLNLEALALQNGAALGSGFAFPLTLDQISTWAENLPMRGYVLAPASSVIAGRTGR
jgi:polysaccharide deacetylase 2 family uncharacterized protein YibQ